jgi:hypothetical protein
MSRRLLVAAAAIAAIAAVAVLAPAARADYFPPRQPEPACTLDQARASDETCRACDADFLDPDTCARALAPQGFTRLCRGRGMTGWTEVWCHASTPATKLSCTFAPGVDAGASAVAWLVVGLLLLTQRGARRCRARAIGARRRPRRACGAAIRLVSGSCSGAPARSPRSS